MFSDTDKWGSIYANLVICEILNKSSRIRIMQNEASGRGIQSRLPLGRSSYLNDDGRKQGGAAGLPEASDPIA